MQTQLSNTRSFVLAKMLYAHPRQKRSMQPEVHHLVAPGRKRALCGYRPWILDIVDAPLEGTRLCQHCKRLQE